MEIQLAALAAPEDGSVDDEVRAWRALEDLSGGALGTSCGQ